MEDWVLLSRQGGTLHLKGGTPGWGQVYTEWGREYCVAEIEVGDLAAFVRGDVREGGCEVVVAVLAHVQLLDIQQTLPLHHDPLEELSLGPQPLALDAVHGVFESPDVLGSQGLFLAAVGELQVFLEVIGQGSPEVNAFPPKIDGLNCIDLPLLESPKVRFLNVPSLALSALFENPLLDGVHALDDGADGSASGLDERGDVSEVRLVAVGMGSGALLAGVVVAEEGGGLADGTAANIVD
jgi:hypothetical protein